MKLFNDNTSANNRVFLFALVMSLITCFAGVGAMFEGLPLLALIYFAASGLFMWAGHALFPNDQKPVCPLPERVVCPPCESTLPLEEARVLVREEEAIVIDVTASTATVIQPNGEPTLVPCNVLRGCQCAVGERLKWFRIEDLLVCENTTDLDRWRIKQYEEWMVAYHTSV